MINLELIERFHEKWSLNDKTGCWEWTGALTGPGYANGNGYGNIKIPGSRKQIRAHVLSYKIHIGDVPEGFFVCHTCDNRKCVKPSHLFLGTCKDNLQDMKRKGRSLHGEKNAQHKLNTDQVRMIHHLNRNGVSQGRLARIYGVATSTIYKIVHGQRWFEIYQEFNPGRD